MTKTKTYISFFFPGTFLERTLWSERVLLRKTQSIYSSLSFKFYPMEVVRSFFSAFTLVNFWGFVAEILNKVFFSSFQQNSDVKGWFILSRVQWSVGLLGRLSPRMIQFLGSNKSPYVYKKLFCSITNELMSQYLLSISKYIIFTF